MNNGTITNVPTETGTEAGTARIERLSRLSARRVIEPDTEVPGELGGGQIVADDLLSVRDLGLELTAEQRRRLAAEEIAAITDEGIRFEAILGAGFNLAIQRAGNLGEPWVTYALHELGEETRHSRLFVRLLGQLRPTAVNPFNHGLLGRIKRRVVRRLIRRPALFMVMVLAGEELPDLHQKRSADHPGTDPFLASVNRYHRQEEARHLSFARLRLPDLLAGAGWSERLEVRQLAPHMIQVQLEGMFHPGIYAAVGLSGWRTWWRVHRSPHMAAFRAAATRPILHELRNAGAFGAGRVPRAWRRLCAVDTSGVPDG